MSKLRPALAALSVLLLASCSSPQQAAVENGTVDAEADAPGNAGAPEPIQPGQPANAVDEPVPPPDAVSHPDGYLPPPAGEATAVNSSAPDPSPPTTEDEYMRNKQAGR
jgi:hypothetical protein